MAAFEKLMLIIDADGKGAIREVNGVAKSVDKLSASEKKLDRVAAGMVSIGTAAVAAGAVAGLGLAKAAKAAGDLEAAVSTTNQVFGSASGDIQSFAADSAKNFGLSKRAANEAAVGFGAFAKQAGLSGKDLSGFSIDLLKLAADLSAFKNVSVDEALQALTSGLAGESEPLRRFGIDVRDVALKAEYAKQTNQEFTGTMTQQQKVLLAQSAIMRSAFDIGIIGQFQREQGQLGTSLAQLQAQWEDALASFGQAALPAATSVVENLSKVIDTFGKVNDATGGTAGKIATFSAGAAVLGGSLAVVVGKAIQMRDAFKEFGTNAEGGLSRAGKAAAGLATALAGIAITDIVFGAINDATGRLDDLTTALNRVKVAAKAGNDTLDAFGEAVGAEQNTLRLQNLWQEFGAEVSIVGTGIKADVEQVQRTFESLSATDPKFAAQVLKDLEEANNSLDRNSDQYRTNKEFIDRNREALNLQAQASVASSDALDAAGGAAGDASGEYGDLTGSVENATNALKEFSDSVQAALDPVFATTDAFAANAEAKLEVVRATAEVIRLEREGKKGTDEYAAAQQKLTDANRGQVDSALAIQGAMGDLLQMVQENPAAWEQAGQALDRWVESGVITAEQAQTVRTEILNAVAAAEEADRQQPEIEVTAAVQQAIDEVRRAQGAAIAATRNPYVLQIQAQVSGLGTVLDAINTIQATASRVTSQVQSAANLAAAAASSGGRDGNPLTPFAMGGMLPGNATIQPGRGRGLIQWAEGETGGEAFIPLAATKRKRSKDIWWETGRRLGVIQMAAGGFSSDEPWGQYAEAMENAWQLTFDSAPLRQQISLALKARDGYAKFSDQWVRFNGLLQSSKEQLARQNAELKDNEFEFNYERSTPQNQLLLAQQRLRGQTRFSDEWVRWTEEIERLQEDLKQTLTPSARASGGRVSSGGSFTLQVNVNAQGLLTDPAEVGRQVVGAVKSYEQQNGTGWRS